MRSSRTLIVVGSLCFLLAGSLLLAGSRVPLWVPVVALVAGAIAFGAALIARRSGSDRPTPRDPASGERLIRIVTIGLTGLGLGAVLVAIFVAVGEAQGHAMFHFLTGFVCVGLFAAIGFGWHPLTGTAAAMLRGLVLTLLAAAALSVFVESLGASGYDAANEGHRIEALARLHNLSLPFAALTLLAVPLGLLTGIAVLIARVTRRDPTAR